MLELAALQIEQVHYPIHVLRLGIEAQGQERQILIVDGIPNSLGPSTSRICLHRRQR